MSVVRRMDRVVDAFVARCRWFHEPLTRGRARMFALQHRLNTRQRNSVLKLKVAANCSDCDYSGSGSGDYGSQCGDGRCDCDEYFSCWQDCNGWWGEGSW